MSYNNTANKEFLKTLTLETCPQKWIDNAKEYKGNMHLVPEDFRELYTYILNNLLSEKTEEKEEPKEERVTETKMTGVKAKKREKVETFIEEDESEEEDVDLEVNEYFEEEE